MSTTLNHNQSIRQYCSDGNLNDIRILRVACGEADFKDLLDCGLYQDENRRPINIAASQGFANIVDYLAPYYTDIEYHHECVIANSLIDHKFHPSQNYPRLGGHKSSVYVLATLSGNITLFAKAVNEAGFDENDRCSSFDIKGRHLMLLAAESKQLRCLEFMLNMQVSAHWEYEMLTVGLSLFLQDDAETIAAFESSAKRLNYAQRIQRNTIPSDDALQTLIPHLVANGLNINAVDMCGRLKYRSMLLLCMVHGRFKAAEYLIDVGADVHVVDSHGCNVLYYLFNQATVNFLPEATSLRILRKLLAQKIDVNCHQWTKTGLGNTPLIEAVRCKHFEAAQLLLKSGADPNIRGEKNMHAGFWLFLEPPLRNVSRSTEFCQSGADFITLIMLQALFDSKMNVNVRDKRYQSMRDVATSSPHGPFPQCCQLLQEQEQHVHMKPLSKDPPVPTDKEFTESHKKSPWNAFVSGRNATYHRVFDSRIEDSANAPSQMASSHDRYEDSMTDNSLPHQACREDRAEEAVECNRSRTLFSSNQRRCGGCCTIS